MEAISGRKPNLEIAANHPMDPLHAAQLTGRPIWVSQLKRQLLDGASEMFTRCMHTKVKEEGQAKEADLIQQIGRLQMEWSGSKKSQLL